MFDGTNESRFSYMVVYGQRVRKLRRGVVAVEGCVSGVVATGSVSPVRGTAMLTRSCPCTDETTINAPDDSTIRRVSCLSPENFIRSFRIPSCNRASPSNMRASGVFSASSAPKSLRIQPCSRIIFADAALQYRRFQLHHIEIEIRPALIANFELKVPRPHAHAQAYVRAMKIRVAAAHKAIIPHNAIGPHAQAKISSAGPISNVHPVHQLQVRGTQVALVEPRVRIDRRAGVITTVA